MRLSLLLMVSCLLAALLLSGCQGLRLAAFHPARNSTPITTPEHLDLNRLLAYYYQLHQRTPSELRAEFQRTAQAAEAGEPLAELQLLLFSLLPDQAFSSQAAKIAAWPPESDTRREELQGFLKLLTNYHHTQQQLISLEEEARKYRLQAATLKRQIQELQEIEKILINREKAEVIQ